MNSTASAHVRCWYIVTLDNERPISANADDPRIAHKRIVVSHLNCKFGKARRLARRRDDYGNVFGTENVDFRPIALTCDISAAERLVLEALGPSGVLGNTGHRNEWLAGIEAAEVERIVIGSLTAAGVEFVLPTVAADVHQLRVQSDRCGYASPSPAAAA